MRALCHRWHQALAPFLIWQALEAELHAALGGGGRYRARFRSLLFHLRDPEADAAS